jgi:hypothetical protein
VQHGVLDGAELQGIGQRTLHTRTKRKQRDISQ